MAEQDKSGTTAFLDGNGIPLEGGTVTMYQPGTLNPVATYSLSTLTTPNPTVIALDANATPQIWIANQMQVRQIVRNAAGEKVWDEMTGSLTGAGSLAAQSVPLGRQQFLDMNGVPLAGGLITLMAPDNKTLINSYQDSALTIPNTNPVVLDAAGSAIIWLGNPTQVRRLVQDSSGNTLSNPWGIGGKYVNPPFGAVLTPSPRASTGLMDAYTDLSGGEPLQSNMSGLNSALNAGTLSAAIAVTAGGPTGKQIIIPNTPGWFGGVVTWVRGAYSTVPGACTPRYNAFYADMQGTDITNYAAIPANFTGSISGTTLTVSAIVGPDDSDGFIESGMVLSGGLANTTIQSQLTGSAGMTGTYAVTPTQTLASSFLSGTIPFVNTASSTVIPVLSTVAVGTVLQVYYSYRDGTFSLKGGTLSGWPMLHMDIQGTANDGDCYVMQSLAHAYDVTGNPAFYDTLVKIGNANLLAGRWFSNQITFSIQNSSEAGQYGYYDYHGPTATWSATYPARPDGQPGNCLFIDTLVNSGAYAGFGLWPTMPITPQSQISGLSVTLVGDGSGRPLLLSTETSYQGVLSGNASVFIPQFPLTGGATFATYTFALSDFWISGNIIYDAKHQDYASKTAWGSDTSYFTLYDDTANAQTVWQWNWNFGADPTGYAGFSVGIGTVNSTGTPGVNITVVGASDVGPSLMVDLTIIDANGNPFVGNVGVLNGIQTTFNNAWSTYTTPEGYPPQTLTHPIQSVEFQAVSTEPRGWFRVISFTLGLPSTLADFSMDELHGLQISFPSSTTGQPYQVYFEGLSINQPEVDGPTTDPTRYMGIPRYTYSWVMDGSVAAYGSWRGPSSPGYMWMMGWEESGIVNPDNGRQVVLSMLNFITDAQSNYASQFPTQVPGIFMGRYGRTSWEACTTSGYVDGVLVPSTFQDWYMPSTDDWSGYYYRTMLSVARFYQQTGSTQALTILQGVISWMNTTTIAAPSGSKVKWLIPYDFHQDGSIGYSEITEYGYACLAQVCILKYTADGDATALLWYRRFLDDLYNGFRQTTTGELLGIYPTTEGSGYTTAVISFTVNSGAVAPTASANIAGGRITHYNVLTPGSGITSISMSITGDGSDAIGNPYLSDRVVGAYDTQHAGWEISEIYNTFSLLVNGVVGGIQNYTLLPGAYDALALDGIAAFYAANTSDARPSMLSSKFSPFHEYTFSNWHWGTGIENPAVRDTHAKGAMWTESLGPTLWTAVEYFRRTGDPTWLDRLYSLVLEFIGS